MNQKLNKEQSERLLPITLVFTHLNYKSMTWEEIVAQNKTKLVTKRYKVTEQQDNTLLEIQRELDIPPSAIVRLALNCFLPKTKDCGFKYEGIKRLWNENKF